MGGSALSLSKYVLCRQPNLERTAKQTISVRPNSSCPPRPTELGVGSVKSKIGIDESQSQDIHTGRALGTKGVQGDTALLCAVKPLKRNCTVLSNRTGWSVLAMRGSIRESLIPAAKTDGVKTDSIAAVSVTKLYPNEVLSLSKFIVSFLSHARDRVFITSVIECSSRA